MFVFGYLCRMLFGYRGPKVPGDGGGEPAAWETWGDTGVTFGELTSVTFAELD